MRPLAVAVVGTGRLGTFHARALAGLEGARLAGLFDADVARAETLGEELGVPVFPTLDACLASCEAVVCATPTSAHESVGLKALSHNCHLLMEKPISADVEGAHALCEAAASRGLTLAVGHSERFNPAFSAAFGEFARPMYVEAARLSPFAGRGLDVDVVLDLMIHDIDLLLLVTRSSPAVVRAVGVPVLTAEVDIASAWIEMESGATANLTASRVSMQRYRKFRAYQADKYISLDLAERTVEMAIRRDGAVLPYFPDVDGDRRPLSEEDADFVAAVVEKRRPMTTGEEAVAALQLALRVKESIAESAARGGVPLK